MTTGETIIAETIIGETTTDETTTGETTTDETTTGETTEETTTGETTIVEDIQDTMTVVATMIAEDTMIGTIGAADTTIVVATRTSDATDSMPRNYNNKFLYRTTTINSSSQTLPAARRDSTPTIQPKASGPRSSSRSGG